MSLLAQLVVGFGAGLIGHCGPEVIVKLIEAHQRGSGIFYRERFHPPSCYVCGHPGPMGELAPNLPCCAPCRELIAVEVEATFGPLREAVRDRIQRVIAIQREDR